MYISRKVMWAGMGGGLAPIYGHQQKLKNGVPYFWTKLMTFPLPRRLTTAANRAQEAAAGRIAELLPEEDKPTWQLKYHHFV